MKYIPDGVTRFGYRQLLKLNKNSPTILVVTGVVGLGATAVLAAKATRNLDPILGKHAKQRIDIASNATSTRDEQKQLIKLYGSTAIEMGRLYGPALVVGTISAASVLHGHRILHGRHLATMAAYSGLMEQYQAYRARVSETVGPDMERSIHEGAIGRWEEDPDHKGEYKLKPTHTDLPASYLRPWFDETNQNFTRDPTANFLFLKGVQVHMNRLLQLRGHVFLFDVYDALGMPRPHESIVTGWLYDNPKGDGYIDFGFMSGTDPNTIAFRNGAEKTVQLNFNIDGVIWEDI